MSSHRPPERPVPQPRAPRSNWRLRDPEQAVAFPLRETLGDTGRLLARNPLPLLCHAVVLVVPLILLSAAPTRLMQAGEYEGMSGLFVNQATRYAHAFFFCLSQGLLCAGVIRAAGGRPFDLAGSYRVAAARVGPLLRTSALSALIVWLWSLLCWIAAVFGVRTTFVAAPLAVTHAEIRSGAIGRSSRIMTKHLRAVVLLTLMFGVPYTVIDVVGTYYDQVFFMTTLDDTLFGVRPTDTTHWPFTVLSPALRGVAVASLITVWSVLTCVAFVRLTEPGSDGRTAEELVEVF